MSQEIFKSDRYFRVFDMYVSHGQLLLRAQKDEQYSHNIDIVFFDTTYIQLYSMLYGVHIRVVSNNDIIKYESVKKYLGYQNNHLFEIESNSEKYYIAASFVRVFENTLDFGESTAGLSNYGREIELVHSSNIIL